MGMLTLKWNVTVKCAEWADPDNNECLSLVAEVDSVLISMVIAVLVIVIISLIAVMGGVLATSHVAKLIREERHNKPSSNSSRKSSATQYDVGNTHAKQLPLPGFTTNTPIAEFAETRARAATSPDILTAEGKRTPFESNNIRDSRRSIFGLKLNRKNQEDQEKKSHENSKKKKKDKILMNHPTASGLLQNMRVINYELTGKGNFHPPPDRKKNGNENSEEHPLVPMSSDMSSPEADVPIKSDTKGNPVYYTLEVEHEGPNDDAQSPTSSEERSYITNSQRGKASSISSSIPNHVGQRFSSRSMSDAFETKRNNRTTFRLMSEGNGKNTYSATLDPKHFSAKMRTHQRSGSVDQAYLNRASQVYEDVNNDNDSVQSYSGTGDYHSYDQLDTFDKPDSYCLLSRSLEDGLGGYKEWVDLPGYQKLQVGSHTDDDYDMNVGIAV